MYYFWRLNFKSTQTTWDAQNNNQCLNWWKHHLLKAPLFVKVKVENISPKLIWKAPYIQLLHLLG